MKIIVVHDQRDRILALVNLQTDPDKPAFRVKPQSGQEAREMDVPVQLEGQKLSSLHSRLRIDRSKGEPRLVSK